MGETDRNHKNEYRQRNRSRFTLGADGNALVALFALNVIFFFGTDGYTGWHVCRRKNT